jgi:hypothetical protein
MSYLDSVDSRIGPEMHVIRRIVEFHWRRAGWTGDVHVSSDPLSGDFCSSRLYPVGGIWQCIPKPGKWLTRIGHSVVSKRTPGQILAIMDQFRPFSNVPFIGDVVLTVSRLVEAAYPGVERELPDEFKHNSHYGTSGIIPPPTAESWAWFRDTYGVGEDERREFVLKLSRVYRLPWVVDVGSLDSMFRIDLGLCAAQPFIISVLKSLLSSFMSKAEKKAVKKIDDAEKRVVKAAKDVRRSERGRREKVQTSKVQMKDDFSRLASSQPTAAANLRRQAKMFQPSYVERMAYQYLRGVANPWLEGQPGSPHGRPPQVATQLWSIPFSGSFGANASGFCCGLIQADGWQSAAASNGSSLTDMLIPYNRVLGVNNNNALFYGMTTTSSGTTITSAQVINPPAAGLWSAVPGGAGSTAATVIPGCTASRLGFKYRLVSIAMRICPVSPEQTTQGVVLAFRRVNSDDVNTAHIIEGQSYDYVSSLTPDIIEKKELSIPEWPAGKWMEVVCIPSTGCATKMFPLSATPATTNGAADAGFLISGAASGQMFRYEAVANYETTKIPSFLAGNSQGPQPLAYEAANVPQAQLLAMRKNGVNVVNPELPRSDRPAIQAMADHKVINDPNGQEESWLNTLVGGAVKAAPYVESALGLLASLF